MTFTNIGGPMWGYVIAAAVVITVYTYLQWRSGEGVTSRGADEREQTIVETFVGAWGEAINADWPDKLFLLPLVAFLSVATLPFLPIIWPLEKLGVFGMESGWSLP